MSKLSIIIATYNSEKTLQSTFDSIFHQTWNDYEVIVIDGDSKNKTKNISVIIILYSIVLEDFIKLLRRILSYKWFYCID